MTHYIYHGSFVLKEKEEKWAKTETIRLEKQKKAEAMKATVQVYICYCMSFL